MRPIILPLSLRFHFALSLLGQLFDRVDLIKPVSAVRSYVRTLVRVRQVRAQKHFFRFQNEICHVGRGRWVMHDGMQYYQIQGQGHEPFKVRNPSIFKSYLLFTMGAGNWPRILQLRHNIPKFDRTWFFIFGLVFCVTWLRSWHKRQFWRVFRQSRTGLIVLIMCIDCLDSFHWRYVC